MGAMSTDSPNENVASTPKVHWEQPSPHARTRHIASPGNQVLKNDFRRMHPNVLGMEVQVFRSPDSRGPAFVGAFEGTEPTRPEPVLVYFDPPRVKATN